MKFSNRGRQAASPHDCVLAGLRVLSAVDSLDRRILALDGGSAEVVHAAFTEFKAGDAAGAFPNGQSCLNLAAARREALAIEVGERLRGGDVVSVLNRLIYLRGAPRALFVDNGAEFTGQIVDLECPVTIITDYAAGEGPPMPRT